MAIELTLLSRNYCHLCEVMETGVAALAATLGFSFRVVDVDADMALEARYGERVPVLLHETVELCHYFLDESKVREYLAEIR